MPEELREKLDNCLGDTHLGPAGRRALIEDFITLISQAIADGMPLPGEVGRGKGRSSHFATGLNIVRLEENFVVLYSCKAGTPLTLIALSPTGRKEEEK